jgi:hypothetical protein
MLPWFMAKTTVLPKKKRGPPPTGKGTQIGERWHPAELVAIDKWIASHGEKMTRGQAIRRLVEFGLKRATPTKANRTSNKLRAQELAWKTVEKLVDPAAPPEERAQRRRLLTKGPPEFREDRVDLPKAKK